MYLKMGHGRRKPWRPWWLNSVPVDSIFSSFGVLASFLNATIFRLSSGRNAAESLLPKSSKSTFQRLFFRRFPPSSSYFLSCFPPSPLASVAPPHIPKAMRFGTVGPDIGQRLDIAAQAQRLLHWNLCLDFLESSSWVRWDHGIHGVSWCPKA